MVAVEVQGRFWLVVWNMIFFPYHVGIAIINHPPNHRKWLVKMGGLLLLYPHYWECHHPK